MPSATLIQQETTLHEFESTLRNHQQISETLNGPEGFFSTNTIQSFN